MRPVGVATIRFYDSPDGMCFYLEKPSPAGKEAIPFIFDGPATPLHRINYPSHYKEYLEAGGKGVVSQEVAHPNIRG